MSNANNSTLQAVIEKVRRLLSLAQSANLHEAAAAAAKANELIDAYRLSVDQLQPGEVQETPEKSPDYLLQAKRIATWQKILADHLTQHYGCFHWNDGKGYLMAGRKSDMDVLRYMFAYISTECMRLSMQHSKGRGRTYAESYRRGFVDAVCKKLHESRQQQKQTATPEQRQGLVKLDERSKEAEELARRSVRLKTTTFTYRDSVAGLAAGERAGRDMHLGSALEAGSKTKALPQG